MSHAVDTNVLVRFLTHDHAAQAQIAEAVLRDGFLLCSTVLIETEWVLRSSYGWPRDRIAHALYALMDMPELLGAPTGSAWAIDRFADGADLADMLHLCGSENATAFATFDRRLDAAAGSNPPVAILTLAMDEHGE